jgi:hypothetical protein
MSKLKMIGKVLILFIGVTMGLSANAQRPAGGPPQGGQGGERKEKIEALRVAFITQRLSLTPAEAEKFWPVFNAFKAELEVLRKTYKVDDPNEANYVDKKLEFEQKKLDLQKKYRPQFEAIIGPQRMALLLSAEEEFKKKLLEAWQQRQGGAGGPPQRGPK